MSQDEAGTKRAERDATFWTKNKAGREIEEGLRRKKKKLKGYFDVVRSRVWSQGKTRSG